MRTISNSELNQSEADETQANFLTSLLNSYLKGWGERRQKKERQDGRKVENRQEAISATAPKRFKLNSDGLAET